MFTQKYSIRRPRTIVLALAAAVLMLGLGGQVATGAPKARPEQTVPASDGRIVFIGRTLVEGGDVSFDWSGVYARIRFSGDHLAMRASDTNRNYFNVWVDSDTSSEPTRIVSTHGRDSVIVLAAADDFPKARRSSQPVYHEVVIQKRTEGEQGRVTVHSFVAKGDFAQAAPLRERLVEVVGDSYTCGYGSENSVKTDPFKPETENCNKSYSCIVPRYFGADYIHVAHSGMGIARNYSDKFKDYYMPHRYGQTFDTDKDVKWTNAPGYKPAITIVYLGTNDFSTGRQPSKELYVRHYRRLIDQIKECYGKEHPVLCVAGPCDPVLAEYVQAVVAACGHPNVSYAVLSGRIHDSDGDLGASWHPNYAGHRKKAMALIPYVSTLTGWPLEDKPVL